MVHENIDPSLAARQALHWYRAEVDVAGADPAVQGSAPKPDTISEAKTRGVIPETLNVDSKLYLFCGLLNDEATRALKGRHPDIQEVEGLLGLGVYCSLCLTDAQSHGRDVLVVRALPGPPSSGHHGLDDERGIGIKVLKAPDPSGHWRDEGFAGCWLPSGMSPVADPKGELCLKAAVLTKASLHRPSSSWGSDRSAEVRATVWKILGSHPSAVHRLRLKAQLISWPVVALTATTSLVSFFFLRNQMYPAAGGAAVVAGMFSLAIM